MTRDAIGKSRLAIEQCAGAERPPQDCRFVRMQLSVENERALRDLIVEAQRRSEREQREAARKGQVTGGVWGFVSYGYRISFETGDRKKLAWLHATSGAAWLDFGDEGFVSFTTSESAGLWRILARLGPDAAAQDIVQRLPLDLKWTVAAAIDLNCDSTQDYVFVANDRTHYYVAAAVAPFGQSSAATYVRFALDGDSQDALCGKPGELQEETLDSDVVESLGDEPEGWMRSASCKGLRLESGDCDSFHLYWNARHQKIDWWRL